MHVSAFSRPRATKRRRAVLCCSNYTIILWVGACLGVANFACLIFHVSDADVTGISTAPPSPASKSSRRIRLFFLGSDNIPFDATTGRLIDDGIARPKSKEDEDSTQPDQFESAVERERGLKSRKCAPLPWQVASFPTCNTIHEMGTTMKTLGRPNSSFENLGQGWILDAWKVQIGADAVVLKTIRNFAVQQPHLEWQRRDAVATERLTSSPHVVGIFGHCGGSALHELVSSTAKEALRNPGLTPLRKLEWSRDAALAVAAVHGFDREHRGTLVHGDITPNNFMVSADGTSLQLNDFNHAKFLSWNKSSNEACGYENLGCSKGLSPEECNNRVLSAKTDVYKLGHVLYFILTSHYPYKHPDQKLDKQSIARLLKKGVPAELPSDIKKSQDPSFEAIRSAMKKCYTFNTSKRPSARDIAEELSAAIRAIEGQHNNKIRV